MRRGTPLSCRFEANALFFLETMLKRCTSAEKASTPSNPGAINHCLDASAPLRLFGVLRLLLQQRAELVELVGRRAVSRSAELGIRGDLVLRGPLVDQQLEPGGGDLIDVGDRNPEVRLALEHALQDRRLRHEVGGPLVNPVLVGDDEQAVEVPLPHGPGENVPRDVGGWITEVAHTGEVLYVHVLEVLARQGKLHAIDQERQPLGRVALHRLEKRGLLDLPGADLDGGPEERANRGEPRLPPRGVPPARHRLLPQEDAPAIDPVRLSRPGQRSAILGRESVESLPDP